MNPNTITDAVARLARGGVIAFPTETVYGLGADAHNNDAIRRLADLKGRDTSKVMSVHVADIHMARRYAAEWPAEARKIAERFWPGPVTIVLRAAVGELAPSAIAPDATVGLRCPDHPLALAVIRAFGRGIVGTSANRAGQPPATDAQGVRACFPHDDVLLLDAGPCRTGVASTVVRLTDPRRPEILRQGDLTLADLGLA